MSLLAALLLRRLHKHPMIISRHLSWLDIWASASHDDRQFRLLRDVKGRRSLQANTESHTWQGDCQTQNLPFRDRPEQE